MLVRCLWVVALLSGAAARGESFLTPEARLELDHATLERRDAVWALQFSPGEYPHCAWLPTAGLWDWRDVGGLAIELENPGDAPLEVHVRVDNPGANGRDHCRNAAIGLAPGARQTLEVTLQVPAAPKLWGMRGMPDGLRPAEGTALDLGQISGLQIFLNRPTATRRLLVRRVETHPVKAWPSLPLVDRFGQFAWRDWPGKVKSEADLQRDAPMDATELADLDRYGGWAAGPRTQATGWFRTEQRDGTWWLVTPEGTLFFSLGVDCVSTDLNTFVEGRDGWFDWLPEEHEERYDGLFGRVEGAHSMAEPIGGAGRVFNFYAANLVRKFGATWRQEWRQEAYRRLQGWRFNTLGNWAAGDVVEDSPLPYTAACALDGLPVIDAAQGYWGKMYDVFDSAFAPGAARRIADLAAAHRDRPLCLGYFVDNELGWEGVIEGVLRSGASQPARAALLTFLRERYPAIDALNTAWGTGFATFDAIAPPAQRNDACARDLDGFLQHFARVYFQTIAQAIRAADPNHLYLGCRFAAAPAPVVRAAAEFVDVLSFNIYRDSAGCPEYGGLGKPVLIGEFHFGATDRGMLHPGLVETPSQEARAAAYASFVKGAAECPAIVGTHWFQYIDEPLTGRWYDGENYNIGFVDVTDTPYPELVRAATEIHRHVYTLRH